MERIWMFNSRLDPQQHRDALDALANQKFDLLIIGGESLVLALPLMLLREDCELLW